MFFGDGTGNSGKNWNGLANIVDNTGSVGGIDATSTNTWWRSYKENNGNRFDDCADVDRIQHDFGWQRPPRRHPDHANLV